MSFDPRTLAARVQGIAAHAPAQAPSEKPGPDVHPDGCHCPHCETARNTALLAAAPDQLSQAVTLLQQLVTMQRVTADHPDIDQAITLTTNNPKRIDRNGRRHCVLFVPGTGTISVLLELPAAGAATLTLNAGPNKLMVSDGSYIQLASGNAVNCLYRCTDYDPTGAV